MFVFSLTVTLLALCSGCSPKTETPTTTATNSTPAAQVASKVGEPASKSITPLHKSQHTDATSGVAPQTTSNIPAIGPDNAAAVAEALKATGEKQAALGAIRQYAANHPESLKEMAAMIKSSDPDFTMVGAQGLVALATKEAAAELITAVQQTAPGTTRRELAAALSSFSSPQAADLFMALAGSTQDRELASAIQHALGNSANDSVLANAVQRYQSSTSPEERDNLIAAIRQMQNSDCVAGLIAVLNEQKVVSSTEPLSLAAADTLGIIGSTNAVTYLFGYLNNLRPGDTSPVYDAIGRVNNPESLPLLASAAYGQAAGSTLYSRMSAVQALGNYNSGLVTPVLNWLIQNDPNTGIQEAARVALQNSAGR